MPQPSDLSYPAQEVRRYDRDRFATALFAPADRREDLLALYAFNVEVARVRETVTEPMMGRIRLQWWRETLEGLRDGEAGTKVPIADALGAAIRRHDLPAEPFERLIDAREGDLDDEPVQSLQQMEAYAEATSAELVRLALGVLGASGADQAAHHAGVAWALTGMLRATPFLAAQGRVNLPQDLLAQAGVHSRELLEGKPSQGLAQVSRAVAARAQEHLHQLRGLRLPRAALPALLPATLARAYLGALDRAGHDLFDTRWSAQRPFAGRLILAMVTGRP